MSWSHGRPGSRGIDPRAARADPFVDENNQNINNTIYVCYCLFPFPRRNVALSGWTKVEVLFSIISSYDIMLHLNSCSWSSHFRWTYPFLARLDMPGVSRSLEVYCCHWLFANSKEIGAWKDWAGVGADVLRWRNQQPYWGYWGTMFIPRFLFQRLVSWAESAELTWNLKVWDTDEMISSDQSVSYGGLVNSHAEGLWTFPWPFFCFRLYPTSCDINVSVISHYVLTGLVSPLCPPSWLDTSCFHSVTPKSHSFQDG